MPGVRDVDKFFKYDPATGQYNPELWRRALLLNWMYPDPNVTTNPFTIPAAGSPLRLFFRNPYSSGQGWDNGYGSPFEAKNLIFEDSTDGTAAANWTAAFQEIGEARRFQNNPIHIRTIAGTAQTPALLREQYWFPSAHVIQADLNKISGGAVNARMYFGGTQYYPWDADLRTNPAKFAKVQERIKKFANRRKFVTPFFLTLDSTPLTLTAGQTTQVTTKIGDDGHVELFAFTAVSTGNFGITISEVKTKQTLMNGQITQTNGIGTANFPALFPLPYLVPAGYRLNFSFEDLSNATNTIFITLQGRKIWAPMLEPAKVEELLRELQVPVASDDAPAMADSLPTGWEV